MRLNFAIFPLDFSGAATQMAMVLRFSRNVQQNGSETLTCQNTVLQLN